MQANSLSATWTTQQQFWACIDGQGQILVTDVSGSRVIGVALDKYKQMETAANDAVTKAEEYFKMLEEHGLITKPLTPEEQIAALTQQVANPTELVTKQMSAPKEAKNEPEHD